MKWLKRDHITYLGEKKSASYPNKDYVYGAYINGVVKTDLEDRFPEFKDYLYADVLTAEDYKTFINHDNFDKFLRTFARYATYFYSFNKNFLEDYRNVRKDFRWITNYQVIFEANKKNASELAPDSGSGVIKRGSNALSIENTIVKGHCNVSLGALNTFMNEETEHTKEEWYDILDQYGRKMYLHNAVYDIDGYTHPVFEFEVDKITDSESVYFSLNNEDANEINKTSFYEFGFVSFESEFFAKNEKLFGSLHIKINNSYALLGSSMAKSIGAYKDLFKVVFYIMLSAALAIVFVAAYDAIKKQTYSIGVMKSLGVRESSIFGCFAVHQVEFIAICSVLVLLFEAIFMKLANNLLVFAFRRMYASAGTPIIPIVEFTGVVYLVSMGIVISITLLSLVLSFILIKKMHIVDILKNKY